MGILDGKKILITGVLTDASLAFGVAKLAQEEGAEIILTGAGRGLRLTQRTARKLPSEPAVFEFDVTDADHVPALNEALTSEWGRVDGALNAIGTAVTGGMLSATFIDLFYIPLLFVVVSRLFGGKHLQPVVGQPPGGPVSPNLQ